MLVCMQVILADYYGDYFYDRDYFDYSEYIYEDIEDIEKDELSSEPNDDLEYFEDQEESYTYNDYGQNHQYRKIEGGLEHAADSGYAERSSRDLKEKDQTTVDYHNSYIYNSVAQTELKRHILDLIEIYRRRFKKDDLDHDDQYDDFYNFDQVDETDLIKTAEDPSRQSAVYFDYIDVKPHLNYRKRWSGRLIP